MNHPKDQQLWMTSRRITPPQGREQMPERNARVPIFWLNETADPSGREGYLHRRS